MRRESRDFAAPGAERPVVVWERAGDRPLEFDVAGGMRFTIGREAGNAIVIPSPFVSKTHAVLEFRDGRWLVEDAGSANGTRLNGAPVKVHAVMPGDLIEVGDQRLRFVDRGRPRPRPATAGAPGATRPSATGGGANKLVRLALAAFGTMLVMGALMWLLVSGGDSPGSGAIPKETRPLADLPVGTSGPVRPVAGDSVLVRSIEDRAATAGVRPADALYDEGVAQLRGGRVREAAHLFAAVLRHDPRHAGARARLEEARAAWERAIVEQMARADRAFGNLRYDEAIVAWEQVLQLADERDPRRATAASGVDRATRLLRPR
jgi:hypothetical protein